MVLYVSSDAPLVELQPQSPLLSGPIDIDRRIHPSYELVRTLLPELPVALPGIILLERFSQESEPVFVSLSNAGDSKQVLALCRTVFAEATKSFNAARSGNQRSFADTFAQHLRLQNIPYERPGSRSILEWLIAGLQLLHKYRADLLTAAKLFV
jgi:hypothetical protein